MKLPLTVRAFVLLTLVCLSGAVADLFAQEAKPPGDDRVIHSLPAPKDAEIRKIRTADEWTNPYIVVCTDGYELIHSQEKRRGNHLTLAELERVLLDLPLQRWPLGKVIAVQETGLRSPGDDLKIDANLAALKRLLKSYKIRIDLWPSA